MQPDQRYLYDQSPPQPAGLVDVRDATVTLAAELAGVARRGLSVIARWSVTWPFVLIAAALQSGPDDEPVTPGGWDRKASDEHWLPCRWDDGKWVPV